MMKPTSRFTPVLSLAASLLLTLPAAAETVTVNLAQDLGEARYRASGFLHGFSDDGRLPPDGAIKPLRIQLHRTRPHATWLQAVRMKALGIRQQVVISDGWGYGREHPGDGGNWTKWEDFVGKMVGDAARRGLKPQWDIWNEPDHKFFWQRSPEQFDETWRRGYVKIRQVDPAAVIIGPSWSNVHPEQKRFTQFVDFCKARGVVPDYFCWHFPRDVVREVQECRRYLEQQKIHVQGIMINEYCLKHEQYAGKTAWLIAQIERAGVDFSCHAIWGDEGRGNLDGILDDGRKGTPRGQWWAYERYAAITGRIVATTPSKRIDLVAGKDDRAQAVRVLLGTAGGAPGEVTVRFEGIGSAPYFKQGEVRVVIEQIPENNGEVVEQLQVVVDRRVMPRNGVLELSFPWKSDRDAYAIRLERAPSGKL